MGLVYAKNCVWGGGHCIFIRTYDDRPGGFTADTPGTADGLEIQRLSVVVCLSLFCCVRSVAQDFCSFGAGSSRPGPGQSVLPILNLFVQNDNVEVGLRLTYSGVFRSFLVILWPL